MKKTRTYCGYPTELFIIDKPFFDNTLGQISGFSYFLNQYWTTFARNFQLNRAPQIIFSTSSYHVPRASLAAGADSPLHTTAFWRNHPQLLQRLSTKRKQFALNQGTYLKAAQIMVLGCDRQISDVFCWEKDLRGDMQARLNYSSIRRIGAQQILPSIATTRSYNDVTLQKATGYGQDLRKTPISSLKNDFNSVI